MVRLVAAGMLNVGRQQKENRMNESNTETAVLTAPDVSCGHCAVTIDRAVGGLRGVARVDTDTATKQVSVEYDPSLLSLAQIEAAMAEEGYPVRK